MRGKANSQPVVRVKIDQATIAAAVDAAFTGAELELELVLAHRLDRRAVIDASVGVLRAFIPTPSRWEPLKLNHVLKLATLRG